MNFLPENELCFFVSGIVNRGDSFRRRRSRSNSLCPPAMGAGTPSPVLDEPDEPFHEDVSTYTVSLLGSQGVGKSALISQFMTSECINAYERPKGKCSMSDYEFSSLLSSKLIMY